MNIRDRGRMVNGGAMNGEATAHGARGRASRRRRAASRRLPEDPPQIGSAECTREGSPSGPSSFAWRFTSASPLPLLLVPAQDCIPGRMVDRAPPPSLPAARLGVSVVSCVYNEEQNLPQFLSAVLSATGTAWEVRELIVIASGCTDRSVEILRSAAERDPRVRVTVLPRRDGKASALRVGLAQTSSEVVILENADTVAAPGAFEALLTPFRRPQVSLVCAHPTPTDTAPGFAGRLGGALWGVHDRISRLSPKAGEAVAFRRVNPPLNDDVQDDDTFVGIYVGSRGGESVYAEDAIILNRVPATLGGLFQQRYRINRQILGLWRSTGLSSSTWDPLLLVRAVAQYSGANPRRWRELVALALLESIARIAAVANALVDRRPLREWVPIESTKRAIDPLGRS